MPRFLKSSSKAHHVTRVLTLFDTQGRAFSIGARTTAKFMDSISRYFAVALGRHGVTVNTVSPGMSDACVMGQTSQEFQDAVKGRVESGWTPMRRRGTAGDIADVALLCSDEARFVTGHGLSVDGGSSLMNPDFPLALQVPG